MKNKKSIFMIVAATIVSLGAVMLASTIVSDQSTLNKKKVAVASADINLGTRLTPDMGRLVEWPSDSVPPGSFSDLKALDTRVTKVSVQRGEPLMETKLALPGATGGLSAVVTEGKRAMTVRVNDVVGVAGFALPGNFVDILVSTRSDIKKMDGEDSSISKLVLERILVLAVAQESSMSDTKPKVVNAVTLEVTPSQAEKLDLARSVGQLSLVLRNQVDMKASQTDGATKQSLLSTLGIEKKATKPAVKRVPRQCQYVVTGSGTITQCNQ